MIGHHQKAIRNSPSQSQSQLMYPPS